MPIKKVPKTLEEIVASKRANGGRIRVVIEHHPEFNGRKDMWTAYIYTTHDQSSSKIYETRSYRTILEALSELESKVMK